MPASSPPTRRPTAAPPSPCGSRLREKDGTALADRVLSGDLVKADALVCANDELALAVMKRLREGGKSVPDDVAVVGWDDVMTARYVEPGLTTVRQPVRELGAQAADRLHRADHRSAGRRRPPGDPDQPGHPVVLRLPAGRVRADPPRHDPTTSPPSSPPPEEREITR